MDGPPERAELVVLSPQLFALDGDANAAMDSGIRQDSRSGLDLALHGISGEIHYEVNSPGFPEWVGSCVVRDFWRNPLLGEFA